MPDIKPFRGFRYNSNRVDISDVVAPPYDVISPQQQADLYARSEFNVVRLILNREQDPYSSAARTLDLWTRDNILQQQDEPLCYILSQIFTLPDGNQTERRGFVAACRLEEFGKGSVYPHEKTHSGPKEDRFKLFQATNMMCSQIFGLYSDTASVLDRHIASVTTSPPMTDVMFEGVRNQLWPLRDERSISAISEFIHSQKVFIADGHHRYETALQYRDDCRLKNPGHTGKEAYNFVPMFLTNMHDPGLVIFPTHRLLHDLPGFQPTQFLKELEKYFVMDPYPTSEAMLNDLQTQQHQSYGLLLSGEHDSWLMKLKTPVDAHRRTSINKLIDELDVAILHRIVFNKILGITDEQQEKKLHLEYEKDTRRAIDTVRSRKVQAAFIMNPTHIDQVRTIASAGMVMPQKSTYFYPKLLSGLVNYSFSG